jgi:hypothetical protein
MVMNVRTSLVSRLGSHVARWLVIGPVPSLILVGVLAVAGLSAEVLNTPSTRHPQQLALTYGTCGPVYDGAGQMHVYPCGPA